MSMRRRNPLLSGLALVLLVVAVAGVAFAYGRSGSVTEGDAADRSDYSKGENGMGSMPGDGQTGSMMDAQGMAGDHMMGSFDENKPFDLQFIDQMIMHHQGAIMSSDHMISDSQRPELRQLYENIQKSQSEQIEQMKAWRKEWYPDAEDTPGMPSGMMNGGMMQGMMGGSSMQEMMGANATDAMFLRMMIPHHQAAVDMSEQALDKAEHPELKELAQTIIDEQSAEIEQMRGYLEKVDSTNGI
jgi:uncharacterized protein (DUF305 family)